MTLLTHKTFNILDHIQHLTILKEEVSQLVCQCPVCGGNRLTINKKNGAYTCWSGQCDRKLIRDITAPWQPPPKTYSPKPKPTPVLVKLPHIPQDIPQPITPGILPKGVPSQAKEIIYTYSNTQWVSRFEWLDSKHPKGRQKTFRQSHVNSEGIIEWTKGKNPWQAYRFQEAFTHSSHLYLQGHNPILLMSEGEKIVESLRGIGLAAITLQGSSWGTELDVLLEQFHQSIPEMIMVFLADNDLPGVKKAAKVVLSCRKYQLSCFVIPPTVFIPDLPEAGDIADVLNYMNPQEFIRQLEEEIHQAISKSTPATTVTIANPATGEKHFNETAFEALYTDKPWVSIEDQLYFWNGVYYEPSPDVMELRRCAEYCAQTPIHKGGKWSYTMATPSAARNILKWAKAKLGVDVKAINPAGLNLTNGILQITWEQDFPSWQLIPHHPSYIYTYHCDFKYDPLANPEPVARMLATLNPQEQDIFLKTIAASLDLKTVRKYKGRLIRALLMYGAGSNGKDTLREAVSMLYGKQGMTAVSLSDFVAYDNGRKFPLARLRNCRVNWSSENAHISDLDKLQSLKAFITGDPISIEAKGKDEYEFDPVGVALFNLNGKPNLNSSLEAIRSRYAMLSFEKTFKIDADSSRGEIEADPRFKYDPLFMKMMVLPAFLNRLLTALVSLMEGGIKY